MGEIIDSRKKLYNEFANQAEEMVHMIRAHLADTDPALLALYDEELRLLEEQQEIAVRAIYRRGYLDRRLMTQ